MNTTDTLTPEAIIRSIETGLMAERKLLSDSVRQVKESKGRIKKGEKLLRVLRSTFNIPNPMEVVVAVPTNPKPGGIEVQGDADLNCPVCPFIAGSRTGLAMHANKRHSLTWERTVELQRGMP